MLVCLFGRQTAAQVKAGVRVPGRLDATSLVLANWSLNYRAKSLAPSHRSAPTEGQPSQVGDSLSLSRFVSSQSARHSRDTLALFSYLGVFWASLPLTHLTRIYLNSSTTA